MLPDTNLHVY
uniref:Uncharacterized protein n=1 Tax=Lepeophtheirus salmonis TaxID=72036 RepID=A0A0K2UN83_LEPSM